MSCTCSTEYDSDTGSNYKIVCDDCEAAAAPCSHDAECLHCFWELDQIKDFYYQIIAIGGSLLTNNVTSTPEQLEQELYVIKQICNFIFEKPIFIASHHKFRTAIVNSFKEFLQRSDVAPLHFDLLMTLDFIKGLEPN